MAKTRKPRSKTPAPPKAPAADPADPGVASEKANLKLVHTDDQRDQAAEAPAYTPTPEQEEGRSTTTRDDRNDLGVPMLPGSPTERVGPEDALGEGPTRGDYRNRLGGDAYNPHQGEKPQRPNADEIGDAEGLKGGVDTAST